MHLNHRHPPRTRAIAQCRIRPQPRPAAPRHVCRQVQREPAGPGPFQPAAQAEPRLCGHHRFQRHRHHRLAGPPDRGQVDHHVPLRHPDRGAQRPGQLPGAAVAHRTVKPQRAFPVAIPADTPFEHQPAPAPEPPFHPDRPAAPDGRDRDEGFACRARPGPGQRPDRPQQHQTENQKPHPAPRFRSAGADHGEEWVNGTRSLRSRHGAGGAVGCLRRGYLGQGKASTRCPALP